MPENARKTEMECLQDPMDVEVSKPRKHKHNSKRRRCKKNKTVIPVEDDGHSKVNDVVKFLCSAISKNESETSVDINPPVKIAKESPTIIGAGPSCNHNQNSKFDSINLPSTSTAAELSNLFENLQVHSSKNPIKQSNITDFLNVDLLKKSNCESLSKKDSKQPKHVKVKKREGVNEEKTDIPCEKLKEYFNLNLIKQCSDKSLISQIDSSSVQSVSEIERTFHSRIPETEESSRRNKQLTDYFNLNALSKPDNNLVTSIITTSKSLANESEDLLWTSKNENKCKKSQKRKSRNRKKSQTESSCEVETVNKCPNDSVNSEFNQNPNSRESKTSSSKPNKNRKRQHSLSAKSDTKFTKYFSPEELQTFSKFGLLLSGVIRINQKNYKEAYITAPDKGMDILIEGLKDRNRALEGDEVYFVLKTKEHYRTSADNTDSQRTAIVVGIKTYNHNRGAIGTLNPIKDKKVHFTTFSPRDSRLPRIRIKKCNWPEGFADNSEEFQEKLYFAKITQWNDLRFADGEIVKEIGIVGDIIAETNALLLKYDLDTSPYSEDLLKFLPPPSFKITEVDMENREDFRKECVFSIDPASAVDLDDAVSLRKLPNGNYEIGVHISDVSYFLKEGTPLDKAVSKRATTVYLVQKVYHMLPYDLCQLCSLTPNEDKLAFSVLWEVTPDLRILSPRFTRSIINSCAKFSYQQVQSIIESSTPLDDLFPKIYGGHNVEKLHEILSFLHRITRQLRSARFNNGALKIDQTKIVFSLDEELNPVDFHAHVQEEANQLIEELMLLANTAVAERLFSYFPKLAFLRAHSPPLPYVLEKIKKHLEKYSIALDITSTSGLHESLLKYSGDDKESVARRTVLNNIVAKPMARANYFCSGIYSEAEERRHYALNVPLYTHFTSPIRRYADVMVHRLLAASLNYCDSPKWSEDFVQKIASNCNKQKYGAKLAGEMSTELFLSIYIGQKGPMILEAVVCDIKDKSFDCIAFSTGVHYRLYFEHIKGEFIREDYEGVTRLIVRWPIDETHKTESFEIIEMFSIVKLNLKRVKPLKIEASLLRYE